MAAGEARLIVMATALDLEPATGYAVRKHLLEQGAGEWGGLSVASIYSVLRTLAGHGWLEELADPTGVRKDTRAYRSTDAGRDAFQELWRASVETIDSSRPLAFHVAITLTALVTEQRYVAALSTRLAQLDERLGAPVPAGLPAQVENAMVLWRALAEREAAWIRATLDRVGRDAVAFGFAPA
ncbi:MAG: helix-turn-helix transcriptional regulator [Solirubrobacteraceae bacterium]|nr:helix-turn-helix transcriptional regulator [Solirubrobacteraceae bacterium]